MSTRHFFSSAYIDEAVSSYEASGGSLTASSFEWDPLTGHEHLQRERQRPMEATPAELNVNGIGT